MSTHRLFTIHSIMCERRENAGVGAATGRKQLTHMGLSRDGRDRRTKRSKQADGTNHMDSNERGTSGEHSARDSGHKDGALGNTPPTSFGDLLGDIEDGLAELEVSNNLDMPDPEAENAGSGEPDTPDAGLFVTLEGIDGSGKTAISKALGEVFDPAPVGEEPFDLDTDRGISTFEVAGEVVSTQATAGVADPDVTRVAFPTDNDLGELVRNLMGHSAKFGEEGGVTPWVVEHASAADLAYGTHNMVLPALRDGDLVIADRYTDSNRAYQGTRNATRMDPAAANESAEASLEPWERTPDVTLLLDVSHRTARDRRDGDLPAPADENDRAFMAGVALRYEEIAENNGRVHVVDAEQPFGDVLRECAAIVAAHLPSGAPAAPGVSADSFFAELMSEDGGVGDLE